MKDRSTLLNILVALSLLLANLAISPVNAQRSTPYLDPPGPRPDVQPDIEFNQIGSGSPLQKIDPILRARTTYPNHEIIDVLVSVREGLDLNDYLDDAIIRPKVSPGVQYIFGQTSEASLIKIASLPGVISIADASLKELERPYDPDENHAPGANELFQRIAALRADELTYADIQAPNDISEITGWFDVADGHKSRQAWEKGFTGDGVVVGVLDDGIDFAHPDLIGTTARVTDPDSPYLGWPMAFSQASLQYYARDVYLGESNIASGKLSSRWSDTQTSLIPTGGIIIYQPLGALAPFEYQVTGTSQSNLYKIGSLPEGNLESINGHRVAVLVVDENIPGIYDTVYVDLDNDKVFTDEKPNTKDSPEIFRDMDGDSFADISGGMLVWISDGTNPPPIAKWLWGIDCDNNSPTMKGCPDNGELIIFTGPLRGGYTHGTLCASNIAGQGVISSGLTSQPFRIGGMVQGAAPDVGLMDFGDFYLSFASEDHYLVASLGYDGIPNSGDEIHITSNSYGAFEQLWGGWGYIGRMLASLNLTIGENTAHLFSAGNMGPGYGPQEGDRSPTSIQVGSSTQFGSTNWDSITSYNQIVYGDPSSYYSKGPNRDGSIGVDVIANGGRGAGAEGINYFGFNGAESWDTWGGTSRSAPVAAGNLALAYDAFHDRYGRWPAWYEAKVLLKSSASNTVSSPFLQGSGIVNADRATDLAAGLYGVITQPSEWQVGDWQGVEYSNFANIAYPGDTFTQTFTITNPSDYPIDLDITDGVMTRIASSQYTLNTSDISAESPDNLHTPDYLLPLPPGDIPVDADVMIVRYVHPYNTFDPNYDFTPDPESSWRFLLYNWTDQDGDSLLWQDKNGNGAVNHVEDLASGLDNDGYYRPDFSHPDTELDPGEYIRMDYEFGGVGAPIIVHDPLARMADGYYFGLQHRYKSGTVPTTSIAINVEFYKRIDWNWLTLSTARITAGPRSENTFDAQITIPLAVEPGAHEGVIFINDPGDAFHPPHESTLPVIVNVIAKLSPPDTLADPAPKSASLGGSPRTDKMYQNSWTNGYFNWYGGSWSGAGDWRHYFLDIGADDLPQSNLLIHTWWDDSYPTDINTWILGPTEDCASNGVDPCAWWEPGSGQPDTDVFGPYTLQPIAFSSDWVRGSAYPFETSTGGPDDWLLAPLEREGLHEIALHNVLYSGNQTSAQFGVEVGTINFEALMAPEDGLVTLNSIDSDSYVAGSEIDLLITPSLALPDIEFGLEDGLGFTTTPVTTTVYNSYQCNDGPDCLETIWIPFENTREDSIKLEIRHQQPIGEDIDLFLFFDENDNDEWDPDIDTYLGESTLTAGKEEYIEIVDPEPGTYILGLLGWDLSLPSLDIDWSHTFTHPDTLPTESRQVFSDTVSINQDDPVLYTTASFTTTITTNERSAAMHGSLTGIPIDANIDIYVTDGTGSIVAQSTNPGDQDETFTILPEIDEYRLDPSQEYTVWVHGQSVLSPPATLHLEITLDDLNIWLSSQIEMPILSIDAGETITVTLNYSRSAWIPGDTALSARFVGGPSVLEEAFDELITISRVHEPSIELSPHFSVNKSPDSDRGLFPGLLPDIYRFGKAEAALVAPGELITYTLTVSNTGDTVGNFLLDDYWGDDYLDFVHIEAPSAAYTETYTGTFGTSTIWEGILITDTLDIGASTTITIVAQGTTDMELDHYYSNFADIYDYDSTEYFETSWAGALYRGFSPSPEDGFLALSSKSSIDEDGRVLQDQLFDYEIVLQNPSSEDLSITLTDTLPADLAHVQNYSPGLIYDSPSHRITWSGVVPGSTKTHIPLSFQVRVLAGTPDGTPIINQAQVSRGDELIGYLEDTVIVDDLQYPTLEISKNVDRLIAFNGDSLNYSILLENTGDDPALNIHIIDPLSDYITLVPGTITGGGYAVDGAVHWTGDIPPSGIVLITYTATIDNNVPLGWAIINRLSTTYDEISEILYASAATEIQATDRLYLPLVLR